MSIKVLTYLQHSKTLYHKLLAPVKAEHHLSQTACDILLFLYNHPSFNTAKDISEQRLIAKANVSTTVEHLRKQGFLSCQADSQNPKYIRLFITPAATPCVQALKAQQQLFTNIIESSMDEETKVRYAAIMEAMDKSITAALAKLEQERK